MRAKSLLLRSVAVLAMGVAALAVNPAPSIAGTPLPPCKSDCLDDCPAHPDLWCQSFNCNSGGSCGTNAQKCPNSEYISCV